MRSIILALALLGATAALADDTPKKLTSMDLSVETHKWDGKLIQITAQCFYADKDEYRCAVMPLMAGMLVRVDFSSIEPETMKTLIENNCDTIEMMTTRPCTVNIVFTYESNDRQEEANGSTLMRIIATDNKGVFSKGK
ncbi:MAG: hypothetical protein ABSC25_27145 [Roseiarcus sp.]|jgi:hypothetical protein